LIAWAGGWVLCALSLRTPYFNLFRETLNEASIEMRLDFPELDVASLETLLAALNSADDDRVIAALDLLGATGRVHVIPALILYHPSVPVVVRALELFAAASRADIVPFSRRLLEHPDAAVRAAAMRASAKVAPDPASLRDAAESSCPTVAATALIAGAARETVEPADAIRRVERLLRDAASAGTPGGAFVAHALRDFPLPAAAPLLAELLRTGDDDTRLEAVRAMGTLCDPAHLPMLIASLADRDLREAARTALVASGDPGLEALERALSDFSLPRAVRTQVPRTISRFGHQRAADILLRHLLIEPGGMVRSRIMRGLGRMRADMPAIELEAGVVERVVDDHLTKTFQLLQWRAALDAGAAAQPERDTVGRRLLGDLLRQKEDFAVERLFRALGLASPDTDFAQLYEALDNPDAAAGASARELLEHVLPARWRAAVVGLADDVPDAERLASGGAYAGAAMADDDVLLELIDHPSDIVSALASYHAAEIGLPAKPDRAERAWAGDVRDFAALYQRSLEGLRTRAARSGEKLRNAG
jgi:HEAT repeat protein